MMPRREIDVMFAANDGALARFWEKSKDEAMVVRAMHEEIEKWEARNNA